MYINRTGMISTSIPLFCLAFKEVLKLYFLLVFSQMGAASESYATYWLLLQVVFSSLTGYISDKHSRKAVLTGTTVLSSIPILLLYIGQPLAAVLIDGIFCNVTPVARAAYCDINSRASRIKLIANSYVVQALPWVIICSSYNLYNNNILNIAISTWIIGAISSLFIFKDSSDLAHDKNVSIKQMLLRHLNPITIRVLIAFFFLGLAYHLMDYYLDSHYSGISLQASFFLLGIGIAGGTGLHRFIKFKLSMSSLCYIYMGMLLLFLFGWISAQFFKESTIYNFSYFLPFAFAGSLTLPLSYSLFSQGAKNHEVGFLFGIMESVLSFAEFCGPILAGEGKLSFIPFIILIGLSFIITLDKSILTRK